MVQKNYPGKQAELYLAAEIGWSVFLTHLAAFTLFKAFYDAAYHSARIAEITTARKLPDVSVRQARVSLKRIAAELKGREVCNLFQNLKSYIDYAYPNEAVTQEMYQLAGQMHYNQAYRNNWEMLKNLIDDATAFINDKLAELQANNNMPVSFDTTWASTCTDAITALDAFYDEENKEHELTDEKVKQNNTIYSMLMDMFGDAQKIFRKDETIQEMFTYEYVAKLVSNDVASLSGKVSVDEPLATLNGFLILVEETGEEVATDEGGNYDVGTIKAGTYSLQFSKDGYVTQLLNNVEVATGTHKRVNVSMVKA